MVLTYQNSYDVYSTIQINTSSITLQNDIEASISCSLSTDRVMLVMYSACSEYGYEAHARGQEFGINIDGSDVAKQDNGLPAADDPVGAMVFWLGTLSSGEHTIQGRYCRSTAIGADNAGISHRRLTAIEFSGGTADFFYKRNTSAVSTTYDTFQDDTNATCTITPSVTSKALLLYGVCNYYNSTQHNSGKKIKISLDGVDGSVDIGCSSGQDDYPCHAFIAEIRSLDTNAHTIQGRFCSNFSGYDSRVSERQLGVLLFSNALETDFEESTVTDTKGIGTGTEFVDDDQAVSTRTISTTRNIFSIYSAGSTLSTTSHGMEVAVNIDGIDYERNCNCPNQTSYRNCASIHSPILQKEAGTITVKGRHRGGNYPDEPGNYIHKRTLCTLWFLEPSAAIDVYKILSCSCNLLKYITKDISSIFSNNKYVTKAIEAINNIKSLVFKPFSFISTYREYVNKLFDQSYNIKSEISKILSSTYTIRVYINKIIRSLYNVSTILVNKMLSIGYINKKYISKIISSSYHNLLIVISEIVSKHSVKTLINRALSFVVENIFLKIDKQLKLSYIGKELIDKILSIKYSVSLLEVRATLTLLLKNNKLSLLLHKAKIALKKYIKRGS